LRGNIHILISKNHYFLIQLHKCSTQIEFSSSLVHSSIRSHVTKILDRRNDKEREFERKHTHSDFKNHYFLVQLHKCSTLIEFSSSLVHNSIRSHVTKILDRQKDKERDFERKHRHSDFKNHYFLIQLHKCSTQIEFPSSLVPTFIPNPVKRRF
jgi:hypothetical protein